MAGRTWAKDPRGGLSIGAMTIRSVRRGSAAVLVASAVAACGGASPREVPSLAVPPPARPTTAEATPPSAPVDDALARCIAPALASEALACPPGSRAAENFEDVVAESERIARSHKSIFPPAVSARDDDAHPRALSPEDTALLARAKRFVCHAPAGPRRAVVRHVAARVYFEKRHWEEAAVLFHANATSPENPTALTAAMLSLDCLEMLAASLGKTECFDVMKAWTTAYHEAYCTTTRPTDDTLCVRLELVLDDIRRMTNHLVVSDHDLEEAARLREGADRLRWQLEAHERARRATPNADAGASTVP